MHKISNYFIYKFFNISRIYFDVRVSLGKNLTNRRSLKMIEIMHSIHYRVLIKTKSI